MNTQIETIGPELAKTYLKNNTANRNVRRTHVKWLAGMMSRGQWKLTHQGIAFDLAGRLIDGQHRLMAIIEAGVPVELVVTRGVETSGFYVCDLAVGRTAADVTGMPREEVEVLAVLANLSRDADLGGKTGPDEITRLHAVFGDACGQITKTTKRGTTRATVRAAFVLALAEGFVVASTYQKLAVWDFDGLTPVMSALVKQLLERASRGGSEQRAQEFVRTLYALNPENENCGKIQIKNVRDHLNEASKRVNRLLMAKEVAA